MEKVESLHSAQIIKQNKTGKQPWYSMEPPVHVHYDLISSFIDTPACLQSNCPVQETGH